MAKALEAHDIFVRQVVEENGGRLIKSKGEGDSTFSVFDSPSAAVVVRSGDSHWCRLVVVAIWRAAGAGRCTHGGDR